MKIGIISIDEVPDMRSKDDISNLLIASLAITTRLQEFDNANDILIILGTAIQTWCHENGYSSQEVSLALCNNICDIQDKLDGFKGDKLDE